MRMEKAVDMSSKSPRSRNKGRSRKASGNAASMERGVAPPSMWVCERKLCLNQAQATGFVLRESCKIQNGTVFTTGVYDSTGCPSASTSTIMTPTATPVAAATESTINDGSNKQAKIPDQYVYSCTKDQQGRITFRKKHTQHGRFDPEP